MGLFSRKTNEVKNDLPPPPAPGNSEKVEEPKTEASFVPPPIPGGSTFDDIKKQVSDSEEESHDEEIPQSGDDSSLFDISDLDLEEEDHHDNEDSASHDEDNFSLEHDDSIETVDTSLDRDDSLNFISSKNTASKSGSPSQEYFVTTHQFRALLELVEAVKTKVKDASETHLRLLDVKSEEDIEYENLRKDFQFIEDKLYELDSLIFEK